MIASVAGRLAAKGADRVVVQTGGGVGYDGGLAEYMLVPSSRHLIPIDGLQAAAAAPL